MYYISGLVIGIMGSLHCIGMCAPLSMVIHSPAMWKSRLVYNSGRLLTYGFIGLLVGFIGQLVAMGGIQQVLSLMAGVVLLIAAFFPYLSKKLQSSPSWYNRLIAALKRAMGAYIRKRGWGSSLMVGMLNGLLPCGLVYLALAGAALAGSASGGMIYMLFFGLGTIPAMMLAPLIGKWLHQHLGFDLNKAFPVFLGILGFIFILRGMNLGIPVLSPELFLEANGPIPDC
jgi:sulfite exporter TauE/SafE